MYRFFVRVFAAGDAPTSAAPLSATFDDASSALARLPRMFLEPDGSFVWKPPDEAPSWQVDGNLVDQGASLFYAELKGECPEASFNQVLACFGENPRGLVFEWVERGLLMNEETFRRSATNPAFHALPPGD